MRWTDPCACVSRLIAEIMYINGTCHSAGHLSLFLPPLALLMPLAPSQGVAQIM